MSGHEQRVGDHRVICAMSGFLAWASDCVKTDEGHYVLRRFAGEETQPHPQEKVRAKPDNQRVPWSQPEATDTFLSPGDVTAADL